MTRVLFEPPTWRADAGGFFTASSAVHVVDRLGLARCGARVLGVDVEDGSVRFDRPLAKRASGGALGVGDVLICDLMRRPQKLSTLAAIGADGEERWRVDLPGITTLAGACVAEGEVWIPMVRPKRGPAILRLLAPTERGDGETLGLERGALWLAPHAGRVAVANPHAPEPRWGAYHLGARGDAEPLDVGLAQRVAAADGALFVTTRAGSLLALDEAWRTRWSVDGAALPLAAAEGRCVGVVDGAPTALDAADGSVAWRAAADDVSALHVDGGLVWARHPRGQRAFRLADGEEVATAPYGFGPIRRAAERFVALGNGGVVGELVGVGVTLIEPV